MIRIDVHAHKGFKPWLARVTGTDERYGFAQTFVPALERSSSRSGATGDVAWELDRPGLYRLGGSKHDNAFFFLWHKEGELVKTTIDASRALAVAKLLDAGKTFEDARLATRPAK